MRLATTIAALAICATVSLTASAKKDNKYIDWAEKVAQSEMKHNPELWRADFVKKPKWDYTQGLVALAITEMYKTTKDTAYLNYVTEFKDFFVKEDGSIETYKLETYNIDRVNGGKFLFALYDITKEEKLMKAICLLRKQLDTHPRMKCGVFWH
ncbi:MAG: glycoside hydrolase family 88 protein, partial [Paludibacteraceae bacterium]|nr:glycoside hydrolase family 88 protein [Paludibacteraceae bacterium]